MIDTQVDLVSALKASLGSIPNVLESYLWALIGFSVTAFIVFKVSRRGAQKKSLRETLGYVFPTDLFRHRSSQIDLINFALRLGVWQPLISLVGTVVVGISTQDLLINHFGGTQPVLHNTWTIVIVQFGVAFLISDLASYLQHLCLHKVPILWSFHRCHHSAEALTFLTERRAHPFDLVWGLLAGSSIGGAAMGLALYILGTPLRSETTTALAAFYGIAFPFLGLLQHSHVWISFGRLDRVLASPAQHQLHHSAELRHRDKNLGSVLMIYDWLFGTLYVARGPEEYRWGLNDAELGSANPHNSASLFYFEPFAYAGRLIAKAWGDTQRAINARD